MRVAMLSPIAWRTPPVHYGPWERVVSLLTEGLVKRGVEVTLFATENSITAAKHHSVCPLGYEEDGDISPKVWECLHISELYERADEFDIIHNQFDFLPLSYSRLVETPVVSTIHGFSSEKILPVFEKYNRDTSYVSISNADRSPKLEYVDTVYHGISLDEFTFNDSPGDYLLFFGRFHNDKGPKEAIEIARKAGKKLVMAGIIHDTEYFEKYVKPFVDGESVSYVGSADSQQRDTLLGGAYALLHPINFDEPFGLSVIESMACGTPVIAFNRGSMPELIEHAYNGFLVQGVDEAVSCVDKIKDIKRLNCLRHVEKHFTVERMVDGYISVYKKILEKKQRQSSRPWGYYKVLADEPEHKVKRIVVYPGKRLSLQRHKRRAEHWYVLYGTGLVTLDDKKIELKAGHAVDIPCCSIHRIENPGKEKMAFIEVQVGEYFGEDDIERLEDDFGRI